VAARSKTSVALASVPRAVESCASALDADHSTVAARTAMRIVS